MLTNVALHRLIPPFKPKFDVPIIDIPPPQPGQKYSCQTDSSGTSPENPVLSALLRRSLPEVYAMLASYRTEL